MQHRIDLILEASQSLKRIYPELNTSELIEMATLGYSEHLVSGLDRKSGAATFGDILNFICFGVGSMGCEDYMNSPFR